MAKVEIGDGVVNFLVNFLNLEEVRRNFKNFFEQRLYVIRHPLKAIKMMKMLSSNEVH